MNALIIAHLSALKERRHTLRTKRIFPEAYRQEVEGHARGLEETVKAMLQKHSGN